MNQKLLVVASYPPKNNTHHKSVVGGASYSKNTLVYLKKAVEQEGDKADITVLAERFSRSQTYTDEGIRVKRFWEKNSLLTFPKIFLEILKNHKKTHRILIEFEFAMFGEKLSLLPLPFFVLALRLLNKEVTFVFHQVVTDLGEMNGHLNIKKSGLRTKLLNTSMKLLYQSLTSFSSKVIVFDEILKKRLSTSSSTNKIAVIPHGVEAFKNIPTPKQAKKKLRVPEDTFTILAFGYLAWYKGTDWIAKAIEKMTPAEREKITLIIAGGPNPNHLNKDFYQKYLKELEAVCKRNGIRLTGFVKEDDIPTYFQAADLVVFPYRIHMSASGPLSLALSFAKPLLVSHKLRSIFETSDMKTHLKERGLQSKELVFTSEKALAHKLIFLQENTRELTRLAAFSQAMKKKRIWDTIGRAYAYELFTTHSKAVPALTTKKAYEISSQTSA